MKIFNLENLLKEKELILQHNEICFSWKLDNCKIVFININIYCYLIN
jgi:hypothetical protein